MEVLTAEPVSAPRRRETVLMIIGAVAVVVALGVALAGFVLSRHGDGRMLGPSEAFPSAIAVPARPHAARRAATVPAGGLVYGGLYLAGLGTGEVRAIDIRTGRSYWRYDRPGSVAESWTLDRVAGRLVMAWSKKGSNQVEMIDVRAGRIVWRQRSVAKLIKSPLDPVGLFVDPVTKVSAVVGPWWTVGLDGDTGRVRWKRRWTSDCKPFNFGSHGVTFDGKAPAYAYAQAMVGVFVVEEACGSDVGEVVGFDARTGADRWKISVAEAARGMPSPPDVASDSDFTALGGLSDLDGRLLALGLRLTGADVALIDPTSGRVVARWYTAGGYLNTPGKWSELTYGTGMQVGLCTTGGKQVLCADDPKKGKRLWRRPMPRGLEPHAPAVIDRGRVYLLTARHDNSDWQLIVTDLRTGKSLAHIPLPKPAGYRPPPNPPILPDDVPRWADGIIRTVTNGVIVTGDSESRSGTVDLLIQQ
nr:PQQ-binding-like beta-propeller repeat protein [Actinoallomurus iriomotensis]